MKTYSLNFEAWELSEVDGGGICSIVNGYMDNEEEAKKWVGASTWGRSIRKVTVNKHYVVASTLQELDKLKEYNLAMAALERMSKAERAAVEVFFKQNLGE